MIQVKEFPISIEGTMAEQINNWIKETKVDVVDIKYTSDLIPIQSSIGHEIELKTASHALVIYEVK